MLALVSGVGVVGGGVLEVRAFEFVTLRSTLLPRSLSGSAAARDREPSVGLGCKERFKNRRFQVPSDEELH